MIKFENRLPKFRQAAFCLIFRRLIPDNRVLYKWFE
jgi:hypothetical protein